MVNAARFEKTCRNMPDGGGLAYIIKPFTKFSFKQARKLLLRAFSRARNALRKLSLQQ